MAARKGKSSKGRGRAGAPRRPARYHHGDLRAALLEVAEELIVERGADGFTLREAARRAGVSHSAPYRHFADRDAMLIALAVAGFEELAREGARAMDPLEHPGARLRAFGVAYLAFAAAHPAKYRIMFGRAIEKPTDALAEAGARAFAMLEREVAAVVAAARGAASTDPAHDLAMAILAGVHGLATLAHDGMLKSEEGDAQARYAALTEVTLDLLLHGLNAG